jgi:tetratricopeptide (TPR) repeat protein
LASIEWSHDQLGKTERILFRRMGIFASGFTLNSVESVCVDQDLEQWDVLDGLSSLIDKSLIEPAFHREDAARGAPRYRMLETFRQYAKQQSEAAGDSGAIRDRFVHFWKDVAKYAAENLNGPDAKAILSRLDSDLGNLREAIRIALTDIADVQVALALTGNLMRYWMLRTHWSEGLEFLRRALERPGAEARTLPRATALNSSGTLEYLTGRYAASIVHLKEAIDIFTELGMRKEAARGRTNLGNAYSFSARYQDALREHEAALATAREIGNDWLAGAALVNICNVSEAMGNLDGVEEAARQAVEILERVGDRTNLLMAHNWVGAALYRGGRYLEGIAAFTKGLSIAVEHDDQYNIGLQRFHRGLCLTALERHEEGLEDYRAALEAAHEFNEPSLLTTTVEAYAHSAQVRGALTEAAVFLGLADRLRSDHAIPQRDNNAREVEDLRTLLRDALGNEGYARMEAMGRAMTVEEMITRVGDGKEGGRKPDRGSSAG